MALRKYDPATEPFQVPIRARTPLPARGTPLRLYSGFDPLLQGQTRLGWPLGNCLEACYAGLLGVAVDSVPDPRRWVDPKTGKEVGEPALHLRLPALRTWLWDAFGLVTRQGAVVLDEDGRRDVPLRLQKKAAAEIDGGFDALPWIASGPSERGWNHAVLFRGRRLWHDPHPSRAGVLRVTGWTVFLSPSPSSE